MSLLRFFYRESPRERELRRQVDELVRALALAQVIEAFDCPHEAEHMCLCVKRLRKLEDEERELRRRLLVEHGRGGLPGIDG